MNKIPLRSILFQLSLDLDPNEFNESVVLERAMSAALSIGGVHLYTDKWALFEFTNYCFDLPADLKMLGQVFYYTGTDKTLVQVKAELLKQMPQSSVDYLVNNYINRKGSNLWRSVYESTAPTLSPCTGIKGCFVQFKNENKHLSTNIPKGVFLVTYKALSEDEEGEYLIPDLEEYKSALIHYVMYKHYDKLCNVEASNANMTQRKWHLERYDFKKKQACAKVNEPTLNQYENLRKYRNKMITNNQFERGFTLGLPTVNNHIHTNLFEH